MALNKFLTVGRYDVSEEAVQSFIREGGAVADLLNNVAQGVWTYSGTYLRGGFGGNRTGGNHVRSGRLLKGLFWNRTKTEGPYQGSALAGSRAKHTFYFHDGTAGKGAGFIAHPKMIVPINRRAAHTNLAFKGAGSEALAANKKSTRRKDKVRGQAAKPFLEIGLAKSMVKQRLI